MKKHSLIVLMMIVVMGVVGSGSIVNPDTVSAKAKSKYTIYVNRKQNIVNVVKTKNSKLVRSMYCSVGVNNGTITGTFYTKEKYRWRTLYHNSYGQYATRISGPFLFHSVPYSKMKNKKLYNEEYNKLGTAASMGCVRLAVVDAKWIYDNCKIGTKVVINDKRKMVAPTRKLYKITSRKKYGWDPTDPDINNPYSPVIELKDNVSTTLLKNSKVDLKSFVTVKSKATPAKDLLSNLVVLGTVDTKVPGKYTVTYSVCDPNTEVTSTLTVKFKVSKKAAPVEVATTAKEQATTAKEVETTYKYEKESETTTAAEETTY